MTIERWMQEVNEICLGTFAVSIYELPGIDCAYAFEEGLTPEEFVSEIRLDCEAFTGL